MPVDENDGQMAAAGKDKGSLKTQDHLIEKWTRSCLLVVIAIALALAMRMGFASEWKVVLLYALGIIVAYGLIYHIIGYFIIQWIISQILTQTWWAAKQLVLLLFRDTWIPRWIKRS